ncbi:hypothetical protein Tco_1089131, partial [Tanacetum coccineum]
VAKVSSNSSTPGISPDVAALTTEVSELKNMMKTMLIDKQKAQAPAPVKAVEQSCVTCGGAHSYRNCPATDGNVNRDNIQEYVSQDAVANFNQGNTNLRLPNRVSNQMAPPGFALMQNNGQNRFNQNQNQGNNFNRGNNFHQNQVNHVPNFQNQEFQNQPFQAHNNQFQQGIPSEITSYMKANESIVRNMQGQINEIRSTLTKQEENLRKNLNNDMQSILGSFFQNQTSTSGTLPSNTVPNPKGEMKAITTRSGVAYEGPSIPTNPSPKKVVERETEETTDKEQTNFQGSTAQIPPPVIPISIPEPDIPKNLPKQNIPMEKIFQIFQDLRFDISFADALLLMPRFAPTIKSLFMNKEKLLELAKLPLNENCSVMLLKKLPEKLKDPGKFLILSSGLIDVYEGELVLRDGNEQITFHVNGTSKHPQKHENESIKMVNDACKDSFKEFTDEPTLVCLPPSEDVNNEKEKQEVKNLAEPTAKRQSRITPCLKNFRVVCKESSFHSNKTPQVPSVFAITSTLPSIEPKDSLIMGDDHRSTFSTEEIVPIPKESKETYRSDSKNDLPSCDDFSYIKFLLEFR